MWEKAGVNISVVYGSMPPEAYRAATGVKSEVKKAVRAETLLRMLAHCMCPRLPNDEAAHGGIVGLGTPGKLSPYTPHTIRFL